jgi:small subunit ribosomal protein S6
LLREYDFTIITKGELTEGDSAKILQGYEALMVNNGGEILKKDEWGSKRLSFPIKKSFRGYYTNYDFVSNSDNLAEMERLMRIDDNVLRYLLVRVDDDKDGIQDINERKEQLAQQEREAREREQQRRRE